MLDEIDEVESRGSNILIRPLDEGESSAFRAAAREAFPAIVAAMVKPRDVSLVALDGDKIVGGFAASAVTLDDDRSMAIVRWLFVVPGYQGRGIGADLARRGLEFIRDRGFDFCVSDVDGDNTSSSRIVEAFGGRLVRPWEQWRILGPRGMAIAWWRLSHFLDFGHFLYVWQITDETSDGEARRDSAGGELLLSLGAAAGLASIAGWRAGMPVLLVALAALLLFAIRHLVTVVASMAQGLRVTHRAWDSGYGFSLALAGVFGVYFPMPGGLYPASAGWRAKDEMVRRGRAAFAAVVALLVVVGSARWARGWELGSAWESALGALNFVGVPVLLFAAVLAMAPFACFHAGRIRDWHWAAWLGCAVSAGIVIFWPV